jgi:1-phosphofructokinase
MIITVTLNPAVDKIYWVDGLKVGEVTQEEFLTRASASDTSAGGKGVNISVLLARLGVENVAMGFVGGDTGHIVVRDLRDEGVTTNFVWVNGETRVNMTVLEKGREHIPILIDEAGPQISEQEIARFLRRFKRMLHRASWVVLAGSVPPGVDAQLCRSLTQLAKDAGAKVVITASGCALSSALAAAPYLVKPDTRERLAIDGVEVATPGQIVSVGRGMLDAGVEIVIISHEVTGDIAITREGTWEISTAVRTTQLKNLLGADDVFLGGIVHKLDRGEPLEEALRFGMAAGIVSAESREKIGVDPARIAAEMERVTVRRL